MWILSAMHHTQFPDRRYMCGYRIPDSDAQNKMYVVSGISEWGLLKFICCSVWLS
ncbi:hypothetical protein X975_18655, partial [Stegodyphus mimosarum]